MPHILHSLPYFVAAWLFFCGLYGVVTSRHLVHAVISLAVLQSSTYILLLGIGYRVGERLLSSRIFRSARSPWIPWCRRSC